MSIHVRSQDVRTAIVIDRLDIGGAQKLLRYQMRGYRGSRDQVLIVNLDVETAISAELRALGFDVRTIGVRNLRQVGRIREVIAAVKAFSPQVVHTHLIHATLLGSLAARAASADLVVTLHSTEPDSGGLTARLKNVLERHVLSRAASRIVACGTRVAERQAWRTGSTPVDVIENCVERPEPVPPGTTAALRAELGLEPGAFVFLSVGRMLPHKNHRALVRIAPSLVRQVPGARILLVGGGDLQGELEQAARDAGVADAVVFAGERADVGGLWSVADAFVLPSLWEGLPLALLEAMAAGLPCAASDVGDIARFAKNGAILLSPPDDDEALLRNLVAMAADPELRRKMVGQATLAVADRVDPVHFSDQIREVYRRLRNIGD